MKTVYSIHHINAELDAWFLGRLAHVGALSFGKLLKSCTQFAAGEEQQETSQLGAKGIAT